MTLNDIGNFSFERMDEMAREIVYLKHRVDILERINKNVIAKLEGYMSERINDLERRLNALEKPEKKGAYLKTTSS